MITEQGLESSLYAMLEFGYKMCERGLNLQAAIHQAKPSVNRLLKDAKLPKEILKIHGTRHGI